MSKSLKITLSILLTLLIISTAFFSYQYLASVRLLQATLRRQEINDQALSFTKLFMEKVLRGGSVVSFDDRLQLENSVRTLNDKEIFTAWTVFTNAKSQADVQQAFYNLFDLLLKKIKV